MSKRTKRWIIGIALSVTGCLVAMPMLMVAKGIGRKTLELVVYVIDTQTPEPVANANVTVFRGPLTPLENTRFMDWIQPSEFLPDSSSPYTQTSTTDLYGMCSFQYAFTAITSDAWFRHSGNVRVERTWVHVTAPGRPAALVSIDRQGIHPRDIHDESPIFGTVVMNRCTQLDASDNVTSDND
jgi:hypothetical protein